MAKGTYQVTASHIGYQVLSKSIRLADRAAAAHFLLWPLQQELQEVRVTDRRIEQRRQSESLNVEVVDQSFIQRNLGGSLMTTLSRLPGVKTIGIGSGQSKPLIRGLGFNRMVVVDKGLKHEGQQWGADHGLELDQFAAGKVEIIKGAASFIYGPDAIAGVIDVKSLAVPAPNTLNGTVDLIGKTNNNLYGTSVNLSGRNQHWFFDSRATYQNYGDYRVPTDHVFVYDYKVGLYQNQLRNTAGRETALHINTGYISDRFLSVFYISNILNGSGFFANAHGLEPRQVNTALHDASARDILMPKQEVNHLKVTNQSTYQTGIHRLAMELGYQRNFRQEFSDYVSHGYMPPIYPDTMLVPIGLEREFDKHVYALNLRDELNMGKHTLTLGLNGEHQVNAINGWTFLLPAFNQINAGIFAYDKYRLNAKVLLHGALRYDYGQIRMYKYTDWFPSQVIENGSPVSRKLIRAEDRNRSFNSLVWSAGINYNSEKFEMKANIGKSFRLPIAKEQGANGVNYHYFSYEIGDPALSPEESYQADLSLGWNEAGWSIQLSPFYNYFRNYIYLNPTAEHSTGGGAGNQVFRYAQSQVLRYGSELQFRYQLFRTLTTEILAEYLYAKQLSGDKKGFTLPFSPPPSALFNLTWSPQVKGLIQHTYISMDYRFTGVQNDIVPPEKKTAGYQVLNLQAGTRLRLYKQPVMISLQVQNIFDTRYLNHTSFYRLIGLPEAGRNLILSLKVPFTIPLK